MRKAFLLIFSACLAAATAAAQQADTSAYDQERRILENQIQRKPQLGRVLSNAARELTRPFDYSLLTHNADVLLIGETHGPQQFEREMNLILQDDTLKKSGFSVYATEFFTTDKQPLLDRYQQGELSLDELESKNPLGKTSVLAAAKRNGYQILALEDPATHEDYLAALSPEGMEKRNLAWAKLIAASLKKNPGARVLVYAGAYHTQLKSQAYRTLYEILTQDYGLRVRTAEFASQNDKAWKQLAQQAQLQEAVFLIPRQYLKLANTHAVIYIPYIEPSQQAKARLDSLFNTPDFDYRFINADPNHPATRIILEDTRRKISTPQRKK